MKRYRQQDFTIFRPSIIIIQPNGSSPKPRSVFSTRFVSKSLDIKGKRSFEFNQILPKLQLLIARTDQLGVSIPLHAKPVYQGFHSSRNNQSAPKNFKDYVNANKTRKNTDIIDIDFFNLRTERIHANTVLMCKTIGPDNQQADPIHKKTFQVSKELPRLEIPNAKFLLNTTLTGEKKQLQRKYGIETQMSTTLRKTLKQSPKKNPRKKKKNDYSLINNEEFTPWQISEL